MLNGDLAWRTLVINQNNQTKIVGNEGRDSASLVSPIQLEKKGIGVWSFASIQNGLAGVIEYVGTVCRIDPENEQLLWKKPIENKLQYPVAILFNPPHWVNHAK